MGTSDAEMLQGDDSEIATARLAALGAQERAIQARARDRSDAERVELDELRESLSIKAERLREWTRELEQREAALSAHEAALASRAGAATNPRVQGSGVAAADHEWNLPTVAASIEEARAMASQLHQKRAARRPTPVPRGNGSPPAPNTRLGMVGHTVRQIAIDNPIATFAAGFAAAMLLMIVLWGVM